MNLVFLIAVPLLTSLAILPFRDWKQVRIIALMGAILQLILAAALLFLYWQERSLGNDAAVMERNSGEPASVSRCISILKSKLWASNPSISMPTRKPRSANRVTMNAFLEAATAAGLLK